jgi:predicted RNA-binding protein associated with RNAse of E/G family
VSAAPFARVDGGVDTLDLLVDLVAGPDLTWRWKDEEEYAHGRRLGMVTDVEHRAVTAAREAVVGMIEERRPPF